MCANTLERNSGVVRRCETWKHFALLTNPELPPSRKVIPKSEHFDTKQTQFNFWQLFGNESFTISTNPVKIGRHIGRSWVVGEVGSRLDQSAGSAVDKGGEEPKAGLSQLLHPLSTNLGMLNPKLIAQEDILTQNKVTELVQSKFVAFLNRMVAFHF